MISSKTLKSLSFFFKYGENFNLFPYTWDQTNYRFSRTTSKKYLYIFRVALLVYTLDCVYGAWVLFRIFFYPINMNLNLQLKIMLHILTRLAALGLNYFMILLSDSNIRFYNKFFDTNYKLLGKSRFSRTIIYSL